MIGRVIKPRVFLEGFEIPSYGAMVQASIGAPALATVDIPPLEEFFDRFEADPDNPGKFIQTPGVLPRTFLHIFYDDSEDPDGVSRLLFEGEVTQYRYSKTKDRRSIQVVARDTSNLLTSIYVRYYSDFFTPYGKKVASFAGQGTKDAQTQRLNLSLTSLAGFNPEIIAAMKADDGRGFGVPAAFREIVFKALTTNDFFSNFASRTKIQSKIASFVDTESGQLLTMKFFEALVQQNMSNLKESATIWDLYAMLMSLVFYFPVPILAAPYIKSAVTDTGSKGTPFQVLPAKSIPELLLKPYTWWTAPPNFNVVFPSQCKSFNLRRDFMLEPTRLLMHSFGVIESLDPQAIKDLAPSNCIFIAPSVLEKKFQREAYDSMVQAASGTTIKGIETQIADLEKQGRALSAQLASPKLDAQSKRDINTQIADIDAKIVQLEKQRDQAILDAEREVEIRAVGGAPPKEAKASAQQWNRSIMTSADGVSLASREDIKGIVFAFDYQNQSQVEVTKAKGVDLVTTQNYLANVANYKLALMQYQNRSAEVTLHFCPNVVCGFPMLVVDPYQNFYGEVDSITHIFSAEEGQADTQVQLSFVRGEEIEFAEASRNVPGQIGFPVWINTKYRPDQIGDQIYARLFPENKIKTLSRPAIAISPVYGNTQIEAGRKIRSLYFASRDKDRFALGFTRRNVASIDQVLVEVLGAVKVGRGYVLPSIGDDRFKAAEKYAKAVGQASKFVRSDAISETVV